MEQEQFWDIIERSLKAGNTGEQIEFVSTVLGRLTKDDIVGFDYFFRKYQEAAYTWSLWAAAYTIHGGCSDDGFNDFRAWLVYRGREVYENALHNSDSLVALGREVLEDDEDNEDFNYIAVDAYEEMTGNNIEDDPGYTDIEISAEPAGKDWDEDNLDELKARNPGLFNLFWR